MTKKVHDNEVIQAVNDVMTSLLSLSLCVQVLDQ